MPLFILRHGKAENSATSGRDEDRPLADLGRAQAAYIADLLVKARPPLDIRPTMILTSPAQRAAATAQIVGTALNVPAEPEERLSLQADLSDHVELIRSMFAVPAAVEPRLLIVGHNPTLEELVGALAAPGVKGSLATGEMIVLSVVSLGARAQSTLVGRFRLDAN